MSIQVTEHITRIAIVAPIERVDAFSAPALRAELDKVLETGIHRIIIDLSAVPFLDSAGMAVLVSLLKRTRSMGGDCKLVWPHAEGARRILHLTKFDRVFDMADTAAAAQRLFSY